MTVPARPTPLFADIADVSRRLAETGYLPDTATATAVFLADRLGPRSAWFSSTNPTSNGPPESSG